MKPLLPAFLLLTFCSAVNAEQPRALDSRLKIQLFAESPQIVTPTGIDVDHKGRVWAIESNTHFPPEGYKGHSSDRVLVMEDTNKDGKADRITVFTDGLTHTMSVAVKPIWLDVPRDKPSKKPAFSVYVATRKELFLFHDDDGDLKADRKERLVHLDTLGNYPHNGLAGIAFDAMGWMYFGFGENLGADYKIIGSDGTTFSGGGEGGNMYRCRPDGSKLKQWATGFWNPHASCIDAFGRLFTVDNDPDSRPPCRLLHIIPGGDYGYRYRNGRKGLHPFTSWNGEIPGTLPMVAGTGEAPSGIVAYESDGLPDDYIGNLLVTSWGDHRIDRFRLKPKGASFESIPEAIIQGGENFRPVGIAVAPDGSLYCTDWVLRDYKIHGQGRVWRISAVEEPKRKVIDAATITADRPQKELLELLRSKRLEVRRTAASAIRASDTGQFTLKQQTADETLGRRAPLEALWGILRNVRDDRKIGPIELWFTFGEGLALGATARGLMAPEGSPEHLLDAAFGVRFGAEPEKFAQIIARGDPFTFLAIVRGLSRHNDTKTLNAAFAQPRNQPLEKVAILLAARRKNSKSEALLPNALSDSSPAVRRAAVQWVAEENLKQFRPQVEAILNDTKKPMTTDLFLATLAALEMLDGIDPKNFDKTPASKYVLPLLTDAKRPPAIRTQALRLVDPADPALTAKLYRNLLETKDVPLIRETVRTLNHSPLKTAAGLLLSIATDSHRDVQLRADAITGLTGRWFDSDNASEVRKTLEELMLSKERPLQLEATRAGRMLLTKTAHGRAIRLKLLRQLKAAKQTDPKALSPGGAARPLAEQLVLALTQSRIALPEVLKPVQASRPKSEKDWFARVIPPGGNPAAGRRVFFHSQGSGCYKCHTVGGRGENVGPDLSIIARTMNRKKLAESILEPSKEIAPQFTNWTFVMESGKVYHGLILGDTRDNIQRVGTPEGKVIQLAATEIEERLPQKKSVMPEKLTDRLTVGEFRDLLAFLETLK